MLIRKLFRTAWKYKAQFISMIIMIAIGIGIFAGFNMEWYSIKVNTDSFFEDTEYADFRIYNELGFTEDDIDAVNGIEGVRSASRVFSVNVDVKNDGDSLALFVAEDYVISKLLVTEGKDYDSDAEGFWLSDKYADANGISVGDKLSVTYLGRTISGEVLGLAKSGEFTICVRDANQLMPDYDTFGFIYASPEMLTEVIGMEFYPQINIRSDMTKAELENALQDALGVTTLVTSKDEHIAYAGPQSEVEEGQTMGSILPVLFLAIAVLTMVTTMHRITANEKVQIGTLKALGFKDRRILRHYTAYGLFLGLLGTAFGIGLGFVVAGVIVNPDGMMGTYIDMPEWKLYIPDFCWIVLAAAVILLTFISFLSVKKVLKGTAADALRPYVPKKVKPMKVENTWLWNKLPFSTKWNIRDLTRNKARSAMTLVGVIGCMVLLVGGLGMRDTMDGFLSMIDNDINNYATKINIAESADNEDIKDLAEEYSGDWSASSGIKYGDKTVTLEIYDVEHNMVRFLNEDNERIELSDDGAYVCIRLSEGIEIGDTIEFSPYGEEETYEVKVAGVIRSLTTESIVMTADYADRMDIPYHISAVYTDSQPADIKDSELISGRQTKAALMDSYDSFMEIMNIMIIVLVLAAVVLGIVVLYNLGVMSYVERSRELATLKVVGFRDRRIGSILISQNMWLTILGILIGFPAGIGVLQILIDALVSEYELSLLIGPATFIISVLLTFGVSLIVGIFVARKNKKIDMVEALKGAE